MLNDTDILSDDETDHIYTRIPNSNRDNPSRPDNTLQTQKSNNTYTLHETTELQTHSKQIIPFYTPSFFKYKNYFLKIFIPADTHLTFTTYWAWTRSRPCFTTSLSNGYNSNERPPHFFPLKSWEAHF